jgi:hypothetical protein
MKKIITISFALAALIIFGSSMNSSARVSLANNTTGNAVIRYQVNIHPDHALMVSSCPALVAITDASRKIIGMPQVYHSYQNTYYFYETGPVYGTRMAILTNVTDSYQNNVCIMVNLRDSKSGMFNSGSTYIYDLWASQRDRISPDNPTTTR